MKLNHRQLQIVSVCMSYTLATMAGKAPRHEISEQIVLNMEEYMNLFKEVVTVYSDDDANPNAARDMSAGEILEVLERQKDDINAEIAADVVKRLIQYIDGVNSAISAVREKAEAVVVPVTETPRTLADEAMTMLDELEVDVEAAHSNVVQSRT